MLNLVLRLLITVVALKGADFFLPNFQVTDDFWRLVAFGIILGLLNWIVKPILVFFSVPLLILTIGFFYLVINALILYCASLLMPGVVSASAFGIFWGSLLVSILHWILSAILRVRKHE